MDTKPRDRRPQFSLRSLLAGLTWFALILAICVEHQHAAARQRQAIDSLRAAGLLPPAQVRVPPKPASGAAPPIVVEDAPR